MKKTSTRHGMHPYLKPNFEWPNIQPEKPGIIMPTDEQVREMVKRNEKGPMG